MKASQGESREKTRGLFRGEEQHAQSHEDGREVVLGKPATHAAAGRKPGERTCREVRLERRQGQMGHIPQYSTEDFAFFLKTDKEPLQCFCELKDLALKSVIPPLKNHTLHSLHFLPSLIRCQL